MAKKHVHPQKSQPFAEYPLSFFASPNPDCADFNRFAADNLSIAERMAKDKAIRRLYCKTCSTRFSQREGSLMQSTSCLRQLLSALSNASDMAAPAKPRQTSAMLIREPSSAYWNQSR